MKNKIYVKGIEVYAYHGVFPEETRLGQKFIFDVECSLDFKQAMLNDNLDSSVSYGDIAEIVADVATQNTYKLLERLAYEIIKTIFTNHELISSIKIVINKPNAPVRQVFKECGVVVEIDRQEFGAL
ncbi:MAG: dihydroneopterin aldolase [Gemella sp.]|nr:dihydroneopterin aldolase [Gemella sp.]